MAGSERKDKRGVQQLLLLLLLLPLGGVVGLRQNVIINRHFLGDIFATSECGASFCDGGGSNEADRLRGNSDCECQCKKNFSTFREDLKTCVADLQECSLANFLTSSSGEEEKIPFVFLPLSSGQTIYPNADIRIFGQNKELSSDILSVSTETESLCVVSSTQLLFNDGWHTLETIYGHDFYHHPFRLAQQQGVKTHLQWFGDDNMRQILDGKLVLLYLLCQERKLSNDSSRDISRPCISFRVAGSPGSSILKSGDGGEQNKEDSSRLGASDYIAIGVCVGFLLIVYVVAVVIFIMFKRRRRRKERIRQQFLLPPATMPPGLGYKSSRILGLEEAFIPELRKIEPIPGMSEANLERLQRRQQALEEERRSRYKEAEETLDLRNGLSQTDVLEKNKKLFDAAHRMFGSVSSNSHDGNGIEKLYVNPNFRRPQDGVSHLVGDLPPLSPNRLVTSRHNNNNSDKSPYNISSTVDLKSSTTIVDCYNNDEDEGYPATLNVDVSRSSRNVVKNDSSTSSREIHDPMSLDSGVITTLSRSISPMSSSNRGSSAARMSIEEETNVDDVVNLASDGGDDSEDRDSDDPNYFDSLRKEPHNKKQQQQQQQRQQQQQQRSKAYQHHGQQQKFNKTSNSRNFNHRFNDNANVAVPFNLKLNDVSDPLAKLYDTAVLKIPKVIPSDTESLYSECNSSFSKSRFGESDLYGRKRRPNKADKLEEAEEEDLYEVIRSEDEDSNSSNSNSSSNSSSICDVYVNKYMRSGLASEMSATEGDETEREDEDEVAAPPPQPQRPRTSDISSMGKMIVTISGNSENREASVSSGKLLIEVRDERSREQLSKPQRKSKMKKWPEDEDETFDPDTLERGLGGGGGGSKRIQSDSLERLGGGNPSRNRSNTICQPSDSSISVINSRGSDIHNPDYSFRLFENGQSSSPQKSGLQMIPPDLPPKTRGSSSVYSSNTPSVCSGTSSSAATAADFSANDKPRVPPKVKAKSSGNNNGNNSNGNCNGNGLTAERKQYFEGLSHSGINER